MPFEKRHLCKICRKGVNGKSGLQWQGACKCWIHYDCLQYPISKINEIKSGTLKIACPCPDCKSTTCNSRNCKPIPKVIPRLFTEKGLSTKEAEKTSLRPSQSWDSTSKKSVQTSALSMNRLGNQYIGYSNFPTFSQNMPERYYNVESVCKSESTLIAVEKMCITLGQLTCQLNDMIQKMKEAVFVSSAYPALSMIPPSIPQSRYKSASTTPWHCSGHRNSPTTNNFGV